MQILIKLLNDDTLIIDTSHDSTIRKIKKIIKKKEGIPISEQILIWCGRSLRDDKKLNDYKIWPDSTFYLTMRLRGD